MKMEDRSLKMWIWACLATGLVQFLLSYKNISQIIIRRKNKNKKTNEKIMKYDSDSQLSQKLQLQHLKMTSEIALL